MIRLLRRAVAVLAEAWRAGRAPHDPDIAARLAALAGQAASQRRSGGFERYLSEWPARGEVRALSEWEPGSASNEWSVRWGNDLFAPGRLRLRLPPDARGLIVFLHGSSSSARAAMDPGEGPASVARLARETAMGLACWDWPFNGERSGGGLYQGLGSFASGEREYGRILPALGTSLWREWVAELAFALDALRQRVGPELEFHVVGSSMGGYFSYLAPLLGTRVCSAVSIGSCARISDLVAEGKSRLHGFFMMPVDGLRYFDLDDVVADALSEGARMLVLCGDRDPGCPEASRAALETRAGPGALQIQVLEGHGHTLSEEIKDRAIQFLSAEAPAASAERSD